MDVKSRANVKKQTSIEPKIPTNFLKLSISQSLWEKKWPIPFEAHFCVSHFNSLTLILLNRFLFFRSRCSPADLTGFKGVLICATMSSTSISCSCSALSNSALTSFIRLSPLFLWDLVSRLPMLSLVLESVFVVLALLASLLLEPPVCWEALVETL